MHEQSTIHIEVANPGNSAAANTMSNTANNDVNHAAASLEQPLWLANFIDIYQRLSVDNLHLLEQIYHQHITFEDPLHKVEGLTKLSAYFSGLYQNLLTCDFVIDDVIYNPQQASVYWQMHFSHPKLNKGKRISVSGSSLLKGSDDKVHYHRDYLDVGAMLYEHIPFIGAIVKKVKQRASQS